MPAPSFAFYAENPILEDISFLAAHVAHLGEILDLTTGMPPTLGPQELAKRVAGQTGMPEADIERIIRTVQNIVRTQMLMRVDTNEFLERVTRSFEAGKDDPQGQQQLDTWLGAVDAIRQAISSLGPDHPLYVPLKAERIAVAQENVLIEARIITDLRPVFNRAGDAILQSVITYRLLLDYYDGTEGRRIEMGVTGCPLRQPCSIVAPRRGGDAGTTGWFRA